jgi:aldehyde dehydrogenase (NAD+)
MEYGPAPEACAEALAWLVDGHGDKFGHFIDGRFTEPGDGFDFEEPGHGRDAGRR